MIGCPRRLMYLDRDGILSLHNQFSSSQVLEQSRTLSNTRSKGAVGSAGAHIPGIDLGFSGEAKWERSQEAFEKTTLADEHMILSLESYMAQSGNVVHITGVGRVAEIAATGFGQFGTGVLRFRLAKTHTSDPVADAKEKQMVEFELDRDAHEDSGMVASPVRMCGRLVKCVDRKNLHDGSLSPTSHLACFLRELARGTMPLGFLAHIQPMPGLIYLKPYAIWFP